MELHYDFDKDKRTLTNVDGRVYGGQAFDNASTTLRFNLWHKDEFGNKVEWDPLEEGYYPYIMFLANNPRTKMPFVYGDSSSPVFDGYSFEVPYEITSLRLKSARVEFQLAFIKAGYEFNGSVADMPSAVYLLSAPNGFALKPSLMSSMPDLPRRGPACMPMNPMTCEPSVVGWIEMWKDRGMMLPVEQTLLDQNGIPMPLTDLNAAAYARNGYELSFLSQRGKRQTVRLDVPILDANGELSVDHLPDEVLTAENISLRLEGKSYDGKYNVLSLVHDDEVLSRVDLPIEHVIESVTYDEDAKTIYIVFNTNKVGEAAHETLEIPVGNMVTPYRAGEGIEFSQEGSGANKVYYVTLDQTKVAQRHAATLASAKDYADALDAAVRADFKNADAAITGRVEILEGKVTENTSGLRQSIEKEIDDRKAADTLIRTDTDKANSRLDVLEPDVKSLHVEVDGKQAKLTAGTGIGLTGDTIFVDTVSITDGVLDANSSRPVRNSVVTEALNRREYKLISSDRSVSITPNDATGETDIIAAPRVTVDTTFSGTSANPASSAAIQKELDRKQDVLTAGDGIRAAELANNKISVDLEALVDNALSSTSENPVQNKVVEKAINDLKSRGRTIPNWAESGVEYMAGDVVQYAGALYISYADNNTKAPTSLELQPESNMPYWSAAVHSDASVNAKVVNKPCYIQLFGNNTDTTYYIDHKLGCRELLWSMYTTDSEHLYVQALVSAPSINRLKVRLSEPPGVNGLCISIMRVRDAPQVSASAISGVTVVEVPESSTLWSLPNGTAGPIYVQTYTDLEGKGVTDIMGDVVENPITDYDPVEVTFGTSVSGAAVIAPVTGDTVLISADATDPVTVDPRDTDPTADGENWYLVQCFAEGNLEGRAIVEIDQDENGVTIETGDFPQDVTVAFFRATKTVAIDKDNSTQVIADDDGGYHWHYQHNQGRYVGVQAFLPGKGLANPGVDIVLGLNTVDVYFDEPLSGTLLIL